MQWSKKLSVTDALQPTMGRLVPYLRLTQSRSSHDTKTWFKTSFFASASWSKGHFGEHAVDIAYVDFDVTIAGNHRGIRKMLVTHDCTRMYNNNTPNTWVHYDTATEAELKATSYAARTVTLGSDGQGAYSFEIT